MIRALVALVALLDLALLRLLPEDGAFVYARLAAATIVLLLPGGLVAAALGQRSASATLVWTLAALTLSLGVAFLLGLSVEWALGVLALVAIVAFVFARRTLRPPRIRGSLLVGAAGVLFGLALWRVAGHVDGDALFHLARVRKLLAFDELSLAAVTEFADGGLHPGYAFPLWHGFLACVSSLAGVDPELVVLHEASVLAPIAFVVLYEAGTALFRSAWLGVAVLAGNLTIVSLAAGHGGSFASLALPATSSRQLLVPAALAMFFTYVREPAWTLLATLAAAGLTLTLVHPTYSVFLALPLAGFLVVRALVDRLDARRIAAGLAAFLVPAGAVVLALLPLVDGTASHTPRSAELDRGLQQYEGQIDVLGDGSYRLAPEVFSRSGSAAVAALALIPLAGLAARRRWAAFVLGGSLAVLVAMLVPELFARLSDAVSISQSRRAAGFLPFAFALTGGAVVLARLVGVAVLPLALAAGIALEIAFPGDFSLRLDDGGGPGGLVWFALLGGLAGLALALTRRRAEAWRGRALLAGAAVLLFVLPVAVQAARTWSPSEGRRPSPLTAGLVEALRERVPAGEVVFSDLETSYRIAASAPVYVAANPPAHVADTHANRPYRRREDVTRFLRTGDLSIPRGYRARWLVIDSRRTQRRPALPVVYRDARYALLRLS